MGSELGQVQSTDREQIWFCLREQESERVKGKMGRGIRGLG